MNYEELEKNICYVIKEQHIKLGYTAGSSWLYYPLDALNNLLGTELDVSGMEAALDGLWDHAAEKFGRGKVTHKGDRFCLHMDPKASEYVHDCVPDEPFLVELVEALSKHGTKLDDVLDIFRRHSDKVHIEYPENEEFDVLVYFEDGKPDPFIYCLEDEMGHVTYHRLTRSDLADRSDIYL